MALSRRRLATPDPEPAGANSERRAEPRSRRAVDLFVFAPIGVAMFAKDTVPTFMKMFVSRGQTEIAQRKKSLHDQANQYRTVGKFAVKYGGPVVKQQAEEKLDGARRLAEETFSGRLVGRGGADDATPTPAPKPAPVVKAASRRSRPARTSITNGRGERRGQRQRQRSNGKTACRTRSRRRRHRSCTSSRSSRSRATTSSPRHRWSSGSTASRPTSSTRCASTRWRTGGAARSWARSPSSTDADRWKQPGAPRSRISARCSTSRPSCAAELVPMRGGSLWSRTAAYPEPLDATFRALLERDDACVLVGTIDDVIVGFGVCSVAVLRDGTRLGRGHRAVRHSRRAVGERGGGAAQRARRVVPGAGLRRHRRVRAAGAPRGEELLRDCATSPPGRSSCTTTSSPESLPVAGPAPSQLHISTVPADTTASRPGGREGTL